MTTSTRPPGVQVTTSAAHQPTGIPTDTGVAFVTGLTEWGPTGVAIPVSSMSDVVNATGSRVSYGALYDTLDVAFHEGLASAFISRVVGPAAVKAHVSLMDRGGSSQPTISVTAACYGDKGNGLTVAVANGVGSNTVIVTVKLNGVIVDVSPELGSPAALAAWQSAWVTIANLNSTNVAPANNPAVVADTPLTGGTDDRASITDTHWTAALTAFRPTLGPGQVAAPGRTTDTAHIALTAHAAANNRFAVLDLEDNAVITDPLAEAAAVKAGADGSFAAGFVPWLIAPPVPGSGNPNRTVPPSSLILGLCARVDATDPTAGTSPAGANGAATYVLDVTQRYVDTDRATLNNAGVCVIRNPYGTVLNYGIASLDTSGSWDEFTLARVRMAIQAQADAIGERYIFDKINNLTISHWQGDLRGMLTGFYLAGTLFPDVANSADSSFTVDVGPSVNTPTSIAAGHLKANLAVRLTESAQFVDINVIKVPITEAV